MYACIRMNIAICILPLPPATGRLNAQWWLKFSNYSIWRLTAMLSPTLIHLFWPLFFGPFFLATLRDIFYRVGKMYRMP